MDQFDVDFKEKYPLCFAATIDGNDFNEERLKHELSTYGVFRGATEVLVNQITYLDMYKKGIPITDENIVKCILNVTLPGEEWRPITYFPECANMFAVSNLGRVKTIGRVSNAAINSKIREHVLTPKLNNKGYYDVHFRYKNFNAYPNVHRLVAITWIPMTQQDIDLKRDCVNHRDGHKWNNQVSNLEWCTNKENTQHSLETGLTPILIFNEATIASMVDDYERGMSIKKMCNKYGAIKAESLLNAIFRKSYKWITSVRIPEHRNKRFADVDRLASTSHLKSLHDILLVKVLIAKGIPIRRISEVVKVPYCTVAAISRDQAYAVFSIKDYPEEVAKIEKEIEEEYHI